MISYELTKFIREKQEDNTWPPMKPCTHPSHNFPSLLYIPPGHKHTHRCPGCGQTTTVTGNGPICCGAN